MRAEHANSIEHDPSPQPVANKVIFPDLLRQKGGHTSCPCAEHCNIGRTQPRAGPEHCRIIPDSKSWALSAAPSPPGAKVAEATVTGHLGTTACLRVLSAWGHVERMPAQRLRERVKKEAIVWSLHLQGHPRETPRSARDPQN